MKTITKWIIVGSAVAVTTGVTLAVTYYRNKKKSAEKNDSTADTVEEEKK